MPPKAEDTQGVTESKVVQDQRTASRPEPMAKCRRAYLAALSISDAKASTPGKLYDLGFME